MPMLVGPPSPALSQSPMEEHQKPTLLHPTTRSDYTPLVLQTKLFSLTLNEVKDNVERINKITK